MKLKLTLPKQALAIIGIPLLLQLACLFAYMRVLRTTELQELRLWRSKEIHAHSNWLGSLLAAASTGLSEYLITGDKDYRSAYATAIERTKPEVEFLLAEADAKDLDSRPSRFDLMGRFYEQLLPFMRLDQSDSQRVALSKENAAIHRLVDLTRQLLDKYAEIDQALSTNNRDEAADLLKRKDLKELFGKVILARKDVVECDNQIYPQVPERVPNIRNLAKAIVNFAVAFDVVMALCLIWWFSASVTRRLTVLTDNSNRLERGEALNALVAGTDEIAFLDRRFHEMAETLNEASRKERALIENARDLICSIDENGVFVRVNPAASLILDRSPESMLKTSYLDLIVEDDRGRAKEMFDRLKKGETIPAIECTILKATGTPLDVVLSAHWSEADRLFFLIIHDITQRRQIERLKRQFVAMITHDLRSPLTTIGTTLDLLGSSVYSLDTEKGKKRVHAASENVKRMLKLISDLLEMEKFEATHLSLEMDNVSIRSVIEEAVESVRAHADRQRITIESNGVDQELKADRLRLVQVLGNLLSNAIKFSPPAATVRVHTRLEGAYVVVEVTDSGSGISQADKELIFEPYKQAGPGQTPRGRMDGTGLGLTICKALVEAHHGTIGVRDHEPGGTIFWFMLPCS